MNASAHCSGRLVSLDVFRGLAIAGMILVNTPGSWEHVYPLLRHAPASGCLPADLVFPFFLFILGASLHLSQSRKPGRPFAFRRALRRAVLLFAIGLLLNSVSEVLDWLMRPGPPLFAHLRIMGVLQRISLTYLLASLFISIAPLRVLKPASAALLLAYWGLLALVPVPGYGQGDFSPAGSLAAWLDRLLLSPAHLYRGGHCDPEGLLSTLPATITVLAGFFICRWLTSQQQPSRAARGLALAGGLCLALGRLWGWAFPITKDLWTSSYVVYTAGWALLVLAGCYAAVEIKGWRLPTRPLEILGRNSILIYVGASLLARLLLGITVHPGPPTLSAYGWIYERLFAAWLGPAAGSLGFALAYLLLWWLVARALYQRGWFVRV
jgi:predicted acyltransferase